MNRKEARQLAETVATEQLKEMFRRARASIQNWKAPSKINKSLTVGAVFNILTATDIEAHSTNVALIAKTNMIREFGEFLPGYEKQKREKKKQLPLVYHQEPRELPY